MYLDPGFGSMVIQIVLGAIAGGGAVLFMLRRKIAKLFGKEIPDPLAGEEDEDAPDDAEATGAQRHAAADADDDFAMVDEDG